jgi:hypothetical protein
METATNGWDALIILGLFAFGAISLWLVLRRDS